MKPNNVIRMLKSKKINFNAFELPPHKQGALETAVLLGVDPNMVFKTIVVTREKPRKPLLVVVPAPCSVDLKRVAAFLDEKKVHLPTQNEAEQLTGLQAGGISALALIQGGFQVILDSSAEKYDVIHVSGGKLGLNIRLSVKDYVVLTKARLADVCMPGTDPVEE